MVVYFSVLLGGVIDWVAFGDVPNSLSILGILLVGLEGVVKI